MSVRSDRRSLLRRAGAVVAGSYLAGGAEVAGSSSEGGAVLEKTVGKLSAYCDGACVWVRVDDRLLACYRAHSGQKYPYFYPIIGPASGLAMTEEAGVPWPHHRSLFLGCDHVNGGNYWQDDIASGQIVSRGPKVESADADRVVIGDVCDWRPPGQAAIMEDRRRFSFSIPRPAWRLIDVEIELRAVVDIHVTKTNHSLFSLRAAHGLTPAGGGKLVNSAGQVGETATFGQVAAWCGYTGRRIDREEAIVLMDHPENPWSPCPWFTRDYGFISATPFQWLDESGWRLPAGESVRLRYRVVAAAGSLIPDEMNGLHKSFVNAR